MAKELPRKQPIGNLKDVSPSIRGHRPGQEAASQAPPGGEGRLHRPPAWPPCPPMGWSNANCAEEACKAVLRGHLALFGRPGDMPDLVAKVEPVEIDGPTRSAMVRGAAIDDDRTRSL